MVKTNKEKKIIYEIIASTLNNRIEFFKPVPFSLQDSIQVIQNTRKILCQEEAVLRLTGEFIIVGDIHGSIRSLIHIFTQNGYPPEKNYIFLGDYVDRGAFSCEVIMLLFSLKCLYPENIYLLRGNHECTSLTERYGFKKECIKRAELKFYQEIITAFEKLPLCAIVNDHIFCVHAGISENVNSLDDLLSIEKPGDELEYGGIATDLLWSDPTEETDYYAPSYRGISQIFGKEAAREFMNDCGFKVIIRAHETVDNGFQYAYNYQNDSDIPQVLTVFSAYNYCDYMNLGAYAKISGDDIKTESFQINFKNPNVIFPKLLLKNFAGFTNFNFNLNSTNIGVLI